MAARHPSRLALTQIPAIHVRKPAGSLRARARNGAGRPADRGRRGPGPGGPPGRSIHPRGRAAASLQGPRRRQRHRQERPHRAQDRRDPRLDGHARDLRARGGSGARRPRHDHARRRARRAVVLRRRRRTAHDASRREARRHAAHRDDRQRVFVARAPRRRAPRRARRQGSLPAEPGAHVVDHGDAGAGRCPGDRLPRRPRVRTRRLRPLASGGRAGPPAADLRARRDADGRQDSPRDGRHVR